jgi:hypothetical protein
MSKTDNVKFFVDMQETIFSEIALDAQTTVNVGEADGYGLATHLDFWTRIALPFEKATTQYERFVDNPDDAPFYPLIIEMASACLLWAMLIRQRNAPNMLAPVSVN